VTGMENELQWAVAHGVSLAAGLTLLNPRLTENYCGAINPDGSPVTNCPAPLSPSGTQLPGTSKVKGNLIVRDDFGVGSWQAYWQGAYVYQSGEWDDLRLAQRAEIGPQPAFGTLDLSFGLSRDTYALALFLTNAFDERGQLFRFNQCASCSIVANYAVPTQPRTVAVRFAQKF
ncbi:MAG TPA: TonB-dependent receptor, partial [Steroidobacteraceae bacterium]